MPKANLTPIGIRARGGEPRALPGPGGQCGWYASGVSKAPGEANPEAHTYASSF
jgi:hypothetical protein